MAIEIDTDSERIRSILDNVTQREKLLVAQALDRPYVEILTDPDRILPALLWLERKHDHGGQDWNTILDLTDRQILEALGLEDTGDEDEDEAGKEPPTGPPTSSPDPETRTRKAGDKPVKSTTKPRRGSAS